MKINWSWTLGAILSITVVPYIVIPHVEPQWIARLFFITAFDVIGGWLIITQFIIGLALPEYIHRFFGARNRKITLVSFWYGLSGLFVLFWVVQFFIPLYKDLLIVRDENISTKIATITSSRSYPIEYLDLDPLPTPNNNASFNALFFPPRYLVQGKTYEFKFLPNTHLILEATPVN